MSVNIVCNTRPPPSSFGVVVWEMLTGEVPFSKFEDLAVQYKLAAGKMTLPIPESCPADIKDLLTCELNILYYICPIY